MKWLQLSEEQRKSTINRAALETGLKEKAIEKDWWVTVVLRALFQGQYRDHILFKGGTSLSKCFNLIERFSEDIDLVLKRDLLGYEGTLSKGKIKDLRKAAADFASSKLLTSLQTELSNLGVPTNLVTIELKPEKEKQSPNDPQIIFVRYPSLYPPVEYIAEAVQIELSARSLIDPYTNCTINSILSEKMDSSVLAENAFDVPAVEPRRTFLEKIFLIHEEFQIAPEKQDSFRKSRHFYDLEKMMDQHFATDAINDTELYQTIINHRQHYNSLPGIDYSLHKRSSIRIVPPEYAIDAYKKDYTTMLEEMIYGDPLDFDGLMARIQELENRIRSGS